MVLSKVNRVDCFASKRFPCCARHSLNNILQGPVVQSSVTANSGLNFEPSVLIHAFLNGYLFQRITDEKAH